MLPPGLSTELCASWCRTTADAEHTSVLRQRADTGNTTARTHSSLRMHIQTGDRTYSVSQLHHQPLQLSLNSSTTFHCTVSVLMLHQPSYALSTVADGHTLVRSHIYAGRIGICVISQLAGSCCCREPLFRQSTSAPGQPPRLHTCSPFLLSTVAGTASTVPTDIWPSCALLSDIKCQRRLLGKRLPPETALSPSARARQVRKRPKINMGQTLMGIHARPAHWCSQCDEFRLLGGQHPSRRRKSSPTWTSTYIAPAIVQS